MRKPITLRFKVYPDHPVDQALYEMLSRLPQSVDGRRLGSKAMVCELARTAQAQDRPRRGPRPKTAVQASWPVPHKSEVTETKPSAIEPAVQAPDAPAARKTDQSDEKPSGASAKPRDESGTRSDSDMNLTAEQRERLKGLFG